MRRVEMSHGSDASKLLRRFCNYDFKSDTAKLVASASQGNSPRAQFARIEDERDRDAHSWRTIASCLGGECNFSRGTCECGPN